MSISIGDRVMWREYQGTAAAEGMRSIDCSRHRYGVVVDWDEIDFNMATVRDKDGSETRVHADRLEPLEPHS